MASSKRKRKLEQERIELQLGVIGTTLRREHIGELVWGISQVIVAAKQIGQGASAPSDSREKIKPSPDQLAALESALEGIKLTLSSASDKFEAGLFLPAIKRQVELLEAGEEERKRLGGMVYRKESLRDFLARGGKIKQISPEGKRTDLTLEGLDL